MTCECAKAVAAHVAACDTVKTHCCTSARTACARFCEAHNQKWTGTFTPEPAVEMPSTGNAPDDANRRDSETAGSHDAGDTEASDSGGASTGNSNGASSSAPAASCESPCDKPEDCRPMTCRCKHATAENVAACDEHTHCCGSARIVCEHFCGVKKDTWTGKAVDASPPPPASSLDEPNDGGDDGDRYYLQP